MEQSFFIYTTSDTRTMRCIDISLSGKLFLIMTIIKKNSIKIIDIFPLTSYNLLKKKEKVLLMKGKTGIPAGCKNKIKSGNENQWQE
jgi:hypothetical protein